MRKLGRKQLILQLAQPLDEMPAALALPSRTRQGRHRTRLQLRRQGERGSLAELLQDLGRAGIAFRDLHTTQSSLEDIFVELIGRPKR
jgi:ABC-2 type transport system ATP-binding protein